VAPDLAVLLLEAVARVTPAFQELRRKILPRCRFDENRVPLAAIDAWLSRWHLDFRNGRLRHLARDWAVQVLRYWAAHPEARDALAVDCGWWRDREDSRLAVAGDTWLPGWNPQRESHATWAARLAATVREEKRRAEGDLRHYDATSYAPENRLAFEWLVLSVCCELSDAAIVRRYRDRKVSRAAVKKARQRLAARLFGDIRRPKACPR
jgi:hypothetical protein